MSKFRKQPAPEKTPLQTPVLASAGAYGLSPFSALDSYSPPPYLNGDLFSTLREAIPIIDTAIYKLVRLTGGFQVVCADERFNALLR